MKSRYFFWIPRNGKRRCPHSGAWVQEVRGYSLIELLVAVGIFSIVMLIGVSTLLSLTGASKKARATQRAVDTMGFVMERMVRDAHLAIRDNDWQLQWGGGMVYQTGVNDSGNGNWFRIEKINPDQPGTVTPIVYYNWRDSVGGRFDVDGVRLTPPEVDITDFRVEVFNKNEPTEYAVIILQAIIHPGTKYATPLNMQASVAQREK